MSGLSYFDSTSVIDGSDATSVINLALLSSTIQLYYPEEDYFDSTAKIGTVYVYYTHQDGRQKKKLVHSSSTHQCVVNWDPSARDGTWMKTGLKVFNPDGAYVMLGRSVLVNPEDLYHASGAMQLNV